MSVFVRAIKAAWEEVTTPETFVKGDEFQSYVRSRLFPKDRYTVLQKTPSYTTNKNDFIENSMEPDFKFRSIKTGKQFFVEAKYRSNYFDGAVDWCKPYQLKRYQEIDSKTPVYIIIGVGQQASAPRQVFCASIKDFKYPKLFRTFIKPYEIKIDQAVDESLLC